MKTLIIGTGVSATVYAATFHRAEGEILSMSNATHLWDNLDPEHLMGQPKPLLVGHSLGTPEDRSLPSTSVAPKDFLKAGPFANLIQQKKQQVVDEWLLDRSWVSNISKDRNGYLVTFSSICPDGALRAVSDRPEAVKKQSYFDRVVIATGAGPNRPLTVSSDDGPARVDVKAMKGYVVPGDDFMSHDWTPPVGMFECPTVLAYGGSATSSWVVELARLRGYRVGLWFTRPGTTDNHANNWDAPRRFEAAFPAGSRNKEVEEDFKDVRKVLELQEIRLREFEEGGPHTYLALEFKNKTGQTEIVTGDLLVYSLGYEHTAIEGVRTLLDADIIQEMVAFYDHDRAISEDQCLLGVGVPDGSLLIVGSGMASRFGFQVKDTTEFGSKVAPYASISKTLPPASRPTEGVAMLMAGIEAFNRYMPATVTQTKTFTAPDLLTQPKGRGTANPDAGKQSQHATGVKWDINFNLCNRTQLATFVASETDLTPFAANLAVALVIKLRAIKELTFGLTPDMVENILKGANGYWQELKRLNSGISEKELMRGKGESGAYYAADLHEVVADFLIKEGGPNLIRILNQSATIQKAMTT